MSEMPPILVDEHLPSTLETLVEAYAVDAYRGAEIELWVFDGSQRRRRFEAVFATAGVKARIRSAYKPLVHHFLEEIDLDGSQEIEIRYPVVTDTDDNRFRLECYPVTALVGDRTLRFVAAEPSNGDGPPRYKLALWSDGGTIRTPEVVAPNKFLTDPMGQRVLTNCGWIRITGTIDPALQVDEALETDQELAFARAIEALKTIPQTTVEPYFDRLHLRIEAPFYELSLPFAKECLSTAEAMHEDLYFSGLEIFKARHGKARHGKAAEDRKIAPGQIVPEIVVTEHTVRVYVHAAPDPLLAQDIKPIKGSTADLAAVETWLGPQTIKAHLDALDGEAYEARSFRGRPIWGRYFKGEAPGVVISSGQHANEPSGPVGALRAAAQLRAEGTSNFAVAPMNNPDGYALFRELVQRNPNHMHHAARYTAVGCDLERYDRAFENEIRYLGRDRTGAELHLNLHGYPSHEWTRPFTGYVPREFERWTLPKGFFLILNYHPGFKERGEAVISAMVDALAGYEPIVELNRSQLEFRKPYVEDTTFEVIKHIPVFTKERDKGLFPIEVITEAPDETIYCQDFIHAHTAQMIATLAAVHHYQSSKHPVA